MFLNQERKSHVYRITIVCKHYAQVFKITLLLLQKLHRLAGEYKNMHKSNK